MYPKSFRESCGSGMGDAFRSDLERAFVRRGAAGVVGFWWRVLVDHVGSVIAEHGSKIRRGRRPRPDERRRRKVGDMLYDVLRDVRYAVRTLAKSPTFTAITVLILALGIGANTTIFTLVNALFFQPPPFVEAPDQLVRINRTKGSSRASSFPFPDYQYYRDNNDVFAGVYAYDPDGVAVTAGTGGQLQGVRAWLVSGDYFDVLGVPMAIGRPFAEEEDRTPGTHPVAVISHRLWQQAYGADRAVLGSTMTLNGHSFVVIGVAPRGFRGASPIETPTAVWVPIMMQPVLAPSESDWLQRVDGEIVVWLWAMGRLKPGVTVETARANMASMARDLEEAFPGWNRGWGVSLTEHYQFHPPARNSLLGMARLLLAVVALVLIIACANVAILMIARSTARAREIGVRVALGAGRGRVVRQLLTESLLLAGAGGIGGYIVAFWSADLGAALMPFSFAVDFYPNARVLAFTLGLAGATAVLFGVTPALQASNIDTASALRAGVRRGDRAALRHGLVVVQVALCIVLVTGSMLFVRSLRSAQAVDLGFETQRRLLVSLNLRNHGYTADQGMRFVDQLLERLGSVPGVQHATTMRMVPFRGSWSGSVDADGGEPPNGQEAFDTGLNAVGTGYFRAMGIPLVSGRGFTAQDNAAGPGVAVVNETAARMVWGKDDVIGKAIYRGTGDPRFTVIGVARDATYYELGEEPTPQVYLPVQQFFRPIVHVLVETAGDPMASVQDVQREIRAVDPDLALTSVRTLEDVFLQEIGKYRVSATLVSMFGFLALVLATVGLYGVLSYLVVQRTRDIGIQVALGATGTRVAREVVARGLKLAVIGIVLGSTVSFATSRLVTSFLYGIDPRDPITFVLVPSLLVVVAAVASFVPAQRATKVDPMVALRAE
jgi:predicted permease